MFEVDTTLIVIGLLLLMVFAGIHVAVALGITAIVGLLLVTDGNFQRTSFFLDQPPMRRCALTSLP